MEVTEGLLGYGLRRIVQAGPGGRDTLANWDADERRPMSVWQLVASNGLPPVASV
jgi:hypothetical protein